MSKLLVLLLAIGVVGFFLREFVEALFITTVIVFITFFFLGTVLIFKGLQADDFNQLFTGLAMTLFSASYILASYIYIRAKKKKSKGEV